MKYRIILCVVLMFLFDSRSFNAEVEKWLPSGKTPYQISEKYKNTFGEYRKWIQLSHFKLSGLHWNNRISTYINKNEKIFVNNYLTQSSIEENQDCDFIDTYTENENECEYTFQTYPIGTIIIKENYLHGDGIPTQPLTLTAMIKKENNQKNSVNNWEYIQLAVDGKLILAGTAKDPLVKQICATCHMNMAHRDYIFSTFYQNPNIE